MLKIRYSAKTIAKIKKLQTQHPHHVVRRKALVMVLKSQDIPHHKIANIAGVCENTVRNYFEAYLENGLKSITTINFYQPESQLTPFENDIKEYFKKTPPSTITQACSDILKLTGVSLKNTQMSAYIKSLGIEYRKVKPIPAKADIEAQKKFHDEKLQPRLEEAKAGKRTVFFVDAAHFVLGAFLGCLWSFRRVFIRTPSGRQRFNVLGALNAITKEVLTITNEKYITSTQVCDLLKKIAASTTKPVTIVLDNARYQRCKLVMDLAKDLSIELLFLPPYSPNLNLIERLWKLVKKECLYSIYYEKFEPFCFAIQSLLANIQKTHQSKLNSLLTLNFQMFTKEQLKNAA